MRELLVRIRDWFRRDALDAELGEELRFHREHLEREARRQGAGDDADRVARRRIGNATQVVEAARERWSIPWLDHAQQDVRYALRSLRRSPAFAVTAILTLALGIGANAAMFGIVDRLMFRPFPYLHQPGSVHRVYLVTDYRDETRIDGGSLEYTRYLDIRRWTTSFSRYAAMTTSTKAVGSGTSAREVEVGIVSASFFGFFDAQPVLGRWFTEAEDQTPRGANVVVLGYGYWQGELGGRADVIGTTMQVDNMPCEVIGVAPQGFTGVSDDGAPAVYVPITTYAGSRTFGDDATQYYTRYNWGWMSIMVRRKPGVSVATASADLSNAYRMSWNVSREYSKSMAPAEVARPHAIAGPLKMAAGPDPDLEARTLRWVSGVALIVLLIACSNVANLVLARALRRRREIALRLALGVSRGRLAAQYLTESLVLAVLGGAAGVGIAQWGGAVLRRLFLGTQASIAVATDWRTVGFAFLLAALAGLLTGLVPALVAGRGDLSGELKSGAREGTYHRSHARTALLVTQGALSVVLLVAAGLFVRSLDHVRGMRLGYDTDRVLLAMRNLRGAEMSDSDQVALGRRLLATAQALPDVEHAAWVGSIPFWSTSSTGLFVAGIDSVRRLGQFTYQVGTPDYFKAMGTRILRGRPFTGDDRAGAPRVAVVSEAMAKVLWPGRDAIGQCLHVEDRNGPCTTVIGIAEDAVQRNLVSDTRYRYYLPIMQFRPTRGFALVMRMHGDPAQAADGVRRALQRDMPGETYVTVRPMRALVDDQQRSWRQGATMFVAFGVLALLVAAVGLYGVIAYNVAQRMHELGVRIALGARGRNVVLLVLGQGVRFAVAGVAVGSVLAIAGAHWIQPLLFRQSATDPGVYLGVALALVLVAIVATAVPALRAMHADPNSVLRSE